mgnify:CR=1 FL=1
MTVTNAISVGSVDKAFGAVTALIDGNYVMPGLIQVKGLHPFAGIDRARLHGAPLGGTVWRAHRSGRSWCRIPLIATAPPSAPVIVRRSVPEQPPSREDHGQVVAIGDFDRHLVADRAARLDDRSGACFCRLQQAVGEREERVGSARAAGRASGRAVVSESGPYRTAPRAHSVFMHEAITRIFQGRRVGQVNS